MRDEGAVLEVFVDVRDSEGHSGYTSAALRVAVIYSVEFPAWIYTYHRLGCIKKFTPFILIYTSKDK